ncbi:hypothetical protein PJ985_04710 [Streptomyces sp. ACA25]|uniref:hypothetical protein n=1 Tax=Streptomyces sp. ACA25 TaxID=3022596 RepID=UPI0023070D55|nr:hypothetical protein [Streptomyces sp. ACA25]MDB1086864.1 hypothetical protein [Streptomyces sp. ACA25]
MVWETLGSIVLGLAVAFAATHWRPTRFPHHTLALATGAGAALFGGVLARAVLGPGHAAATMTIALAVSVALVSLLVRPRPTGRNQYVTSRPARG